MDNKAFELDTYLDRLRYSGVVQPTEDQLETLHRAQVYTIPFENFDILLGRGISLEPAALFDKMVRRKRGGYCFELNGLFLMALQAIGFDVRALLARVHLHGRPAGRGHQLELVTIHGREWIADVGMGSSLRAPIPFELNRTATQDGLTFRLVEAEPFGIMLQTLKDDEWQNVYSFDLGHVLPGDIAVGNHFTSTHPSSRFTYTRVASLRRPNGRVSVLDLKLRTVSEDVEHMQELEEGQPYLDALKANFGIDLDAPYDAIRPLAR
jgi:N-hydroxyarylamine O-acetyltransferase